MSQSSPNQPNRRTLLKTTGLAAAGLALSPFLSQVTRAVDVAGPRKNVLFFTKSSGFQHSVITRKAEAPDQLAWAERILTEIGAEHGFDVTCSKDGSLFTPENLKQYDVIAFYTTGDLTKDSDKHKSVPKLDADGKPMKDDKGRPVMTEGPLLWKEPGMGAAGKEAFLDAIKGGKGFIGFHCATDTFHSKSRVRGDLIRNADEAGKDDFDPYIQMIGGEFIVHGAQQPATLRAVDAKFPGASAFDGAKFAEEWYSLKNFAPDLHVILAQDCEGMKGPMYQRGLFPETWARMHGDGRVFYTSMGHREDVWEKPEFKALVAGALSWASRRVEADVTPNIKQVTPDADPKPFGA